MATDLLRVQSKRHQDPPKYYTKKAKSFMIGKLAQQLCSQGHDSMLYVEKGYKLWTMTLEHLCKVDMDSCIDLATKRHQMRMDHVKWDEPMEIKDSIRMFRFFQFCKGAFP